MFLAAQLLYQCLAFQMHPSPAHQIQDKNLGELIILSWLRKMLPTVNVTPLPYGEEVLTHKAESALCFK